MSAIVKLIVYFAVLILLGLLANQIPRSEREFRGLLAFVVVGWVFGGVLIVVRAVYRFITR